MDCTPAGRAALKSGGVSAATAKLLVEELGYSEAGDLVHITQVGQAANAHEGMLAAQTCTIFMWRELIMPR